MKLSSEITSTETEVITYFAKEGILHMVIKPEILTKDNLSESLQVLHTYYKNEKLLVLLDPTYGIAPNKLQREQIIEAFNGITKAKAVINKNLLTPFVVNFMMKFGNTQFPMKMFRSEESAIDWLNTF